MDLMSAKGVNSTALEAKGNNIISRTTIDRIAGEKTSPTRASLVWISLLLELDEDESRFFIEKGSGGTKFPRGKDEAMVFLDFIQQGKYDIAEIYRKLQEKYPESKLLSYVDKNRKKKEEVLEEK